MSKAPLWVGLVWLAGCGETPPEAEPHDHDTHDHDHDTTSDWMTTGEPVTTPEVPAGSTPWVWDLPEGFPPPVVPVDNPMTVEKVELGRHLFYDPQLSGNGTQSCADCHHQDKAFTDALAVSEGSTGEFGTRSSMALGNVAYHTTLTWANPVLVRLEEQILVPVFGEFPVELGVAGSEDEVLQRFVDDPLYAPLFADAFPEVGDDELVTWDQVIDSLACFVRSMVSWNTPYDDLAYRGELALNPAEIRGMDLFFSERLECHHCHGGPLFSGSFVTSNSAHIEQPFFNTGLYDIDGEGSYPPDNVGLFGFTGEAGDMGAFRPPSLRNVGLTAPYMHDGSIETLEEVVEAYARGGRLVSDGPYAGDGRDNPYKSPFVAGFEITEAEKADLVAFLRGALTDPVLLENPQWSDPFADPAP